MATLDELKVTIRADAQPLERELRKAQQQTQQTSDIMSRAFSMVKKELIGLVPAVTIAGIIALGNKALDTASKLQDMADKLGTSGSFLNALEKQAAQSGGSLEDVGQALFFMNNAIGEAARGNEAVIDSFRRLNIDIEALKSLSPENQFYLITQRISELGTQFEKTEQFRNIFGRGVASLVPLLQQGGDQIRETNDALAAQGKVIRDEQIAALDDLGDKLTEVAGIAKNAFVSAMAEALIAIQRLTLSADNLPKTALGREIDAQKAVVAAAQAKVDASAANPKSVELGFTSMFIEQLGEEQRKLHELEAAYKQAGYAQQDFIEKQKKMGLPTEAGKLSGYSLDANGNPVGPTNYGTPFGPPAPKTNSGSGSGAAGDTEKAAEDYDRLNQEMERYLANLENERELAGLSGKALEVRKAILEATAIATKEGNLLSDETKQKIRDEVEATYDLQEAQRKLEQQTREAAETQRELTNAFRDGLTDIVLHFDNARDAAKHFFEEIASQIIKRKITGPLAQGIGDALGGDIFGSIGSILGFADGGRPPVGRASIVGENGPELFVPDSAGTVIPNGAMGGRTVSVTNVFNISPGIQGTVRAELMNMLPAIEARTKASVFGAIERGGSESRMVGKRN